MVKMTDLTGLTNAITDILIEVSEEELNQLGFKKGFTNGLDHDTYRKFKTFFLGEKTVIRPGGSPFNVVYSASVLGLETALFGSIGNDFTGLDYISSLHKAGINSLLSISEGKSGICNVLITPDGEKTSFSIIGVAKKFDFDLSKMKETKIFHTSGYELLTNPERTKESIEYAKNIGAKLSFDLADPSVIKYQRKNIENIVEKTDILFVTEEEAGELTGIYTEESIRLISSICPIIAYKKGKNGSIASNGREQHKIPIYEVKVVNTCGAGDAYAAGFLFGYIKGFSIQKCGYFGSYIASRICARNESHL
jgi:sugar/nucleoside kinase (ribokinase family)